LNYPINKVFYLLLISTTLSSIIGWFTIWIAPGIKLIDIPGSSIHKIHHKPTPITGGIVLITVLTIISIIFIKEHFQLIWSILVGSWIVFLFGLWDDLKDLPAGVKLFGQLIAVTVIINMGIQIHIFNSSEFIFSADKFLDNWVNILFTILWILILTNAFNFIDSIDGLAIGLGFISTAFYLIVTLASEQFNLTYFCTILLGISISLYYFNTEPAKLFLGDSGSQTIGFILAAIAITFNPKAVNQMSSWFVPIIIFGVPLFDISLVILSRIRRNKWIHRPSNDHVYHRLISYGFYTKRVVLMLHITSLILCVIGFLCLNIDYHLGNIIFFIFLTIGFSFFLFFDYLYSDN